MELSKNSWILKVYKFGTYDPDVHNKFNYDTGEYEYEYVPPNNLCKLFWGFVGSVLAFLISWPVWLVSNLLGRPLYGRILPGIAVLVYFLYALGVALVVEEDAALADIPWTVWVYEWTYVWLMIGGVIGGIIGLFWVCSLAVETGPITAIKETATIIKNKYCPIIKWKDDEEK